MQRPLPPRASSPMQMRTSVRMSIDVAPANQNNVILIPQLRVYISSIPGACPGGWREAGRRRILLALLHREERR